MRLKSLLIPVALAGYAGLAAQPALAGPSGYPVQAPPPQGIYTAGTVMVRVGASFVEPSDDEEVFEGTQSFVVDDPSTDDIEEAVPVDVFTRVDLDDDTTWYISGVWLPIEHFGVELYFNADANLDATLTSVAGTGGAAFGSFSQSIGDFDSYITSLYANWYPLSPTCLIQPYVGIGVSYVDFEDDFLRPVFRDEFGDGFGLVRLGSDFSWTAQLGVDFNFGRNNGWQINASVMYVDSEPDLELGFDTETLPPGFGASVFLPVRIRDEMDFDPWMFNLGVGYRFSF